MLSEMLSYNLQATYNLSVGKSAQELHIDTVKHIT